MNKNLVIGLAVVVVLLLVGGFFFMSKNNKMGQSTNLATNSANPISSIQDALAQHMSLQCDYTTPSGTKVVAYVKNGMIRSDVSGKNPEESGSTIIRDKKIYFWNSTSAMMMDMPDISVTPAAGQDKVTGNQTSLSALEQYKSYCKNAAVSDSLFVLPTGVKFQDTSSMMKMMPSGIKVPTGSSNSMTQQQIQDAMKKYQTPSQ